MPLLMRSCLPGASPGWDICKKFLASKNPPRILSAWVQTDTPDWMENLPPQEVGRMIRMTISLPREQPMRKKRADPPVPRSKLQKMPIWFPLPPSMESEHEYVSFHYFRDSMQQR